MPELHCIKPLPEEFKDFNIIYLNNNENTIGRGLSNSIVISQINISRAHCTIFKKSDDLWSIKDTSSFGTIINNKKILNTESALQNSDIIQLDLSGLFIYKFVNEINSNNMKRKNITKDDLIPNKRKSENKPDCNKTLYTKDDEIFKLNEIISQYASKIETITKENQQLLNKTKDDNEIFVKKLEEFNVLKETQINNLSTKLEDSENKLKLLKSNYIKEISDLNSAKEIELTDLKLNIKLNEEKYEEKVNTLTSSINSYKKIIEDDQNKVISLEKQISHLGNTCEILTNKCKSFEGISNSTVKTRRRNNLQITENHSEINSENSNIYKPKILDNIKYKNNDNHTQCILFNSKLDKLIQNELHCHICFELLIDPACLSCGHTFCEYCLNEWSKRKKTCPLCRARIGFETRKINVIKSVIDCIVTTFDDDKKKYRRGLIEKRKQIEIPKEIFPPRRSDRHTRRNQTNQFLRILGSISFPPDLSS